jgi:hypothetical protein
MEPLYRRAWGARPPAPAVASFASFVTGIVVVSVLVGGSAALGSTSQSVMSRGLSASSLPPVGAARGSGAVPVPPFGDVSDQAGGLAGTAVSRYRGIVLPDLLIVLRSGLTARDAAALRRIAGVRNLIMFDGARITVAGRPATVIGVTPGQFRSWVPVTAASDQRLWTALGAGDFITTGPATARLGLTRGARYQIAGTAAPEVTFAGSARLGITGIDAVVNQAVSRRLGLVRRVAALVSAPGLAMRKLVARVRRALGPAVSVVSLRGKQLPIAPGAPRQITSYLQLFQESARTYCPALSWTVLAAIGQIESNDGQNVGPSSAGALGPMQFLPSTWAAWGIDGFGPPGPPEVMNPLDAVPSAARLLCAAGASAGTPAGLRQAIFAYNHATWYVNEVLALAAEYAAEYH